MTNKFFQYSIIVAICFLPIQAMALYMPSSGNDLAEMAGINAQSYIVQDVNTGQILISKNSNQPWAPASLTKLVTVLVVLDTHPKLSKAVTMTAADQAAGSCGSGGACVRSNAGVKFTVDGLFHAALMPSANNAAHALARSTGFSDAEFARRMNQKAVDLGAVGSRFNEPTGLDPKNIITAADYAKIVSAAFSNPYLRQIAGLTNFALRSTNNIKYNQTIKNTDRLLADSDLTVLGAKTGYLRESDYNFAALVKTSDDQELSVVVLGEDHLYSAFAETKALAGLARDAQVLAMLQNGLQTVLGTSTAMTFNN